jgi:phospholipid transport system substrate-binding protein
MPWWVLRSPMGKMGVIFSVIRPSQAVGEPFEDYGEAMLQFKRDQLKILPFRGDPAASTATVRTEVMRDGKVVPVNFSLRRTPDGWKAWDVTIEGISYARNFRNDFGSEVDQQGLEHLIKRLEAQNAGAAPRAPAATPSAPAFMAR